MNEPGEVVGFDVRFDVFCIGQEVDACSEDVRSVGLATHTTLDLHVLH
ncbi:MAG: hypothetical protein ABI045_00270 [Flavobacteriales bacterium]